MQHWGIMVGIMGVFMIAAAFRPEWRTPILIYSAVEKAFMVYLVVANISRPYSKGFWVAATVGTIVLYTIAYFAVCGFATRCVLRVTSSHHGMNRFAITLTTQHP